MFVDPLIKCISIIKDNVRTKIDTGTYYIQKTEELNKRGLHFKDPVEFEETLLKILRDEVKFEDLDNRGKAIYNDQPQFCD